MRFLMFCLLCLLGFSAMLSSQATLNVPSATYPTIQLAIDAAQTGDLVLVAAGTYVENLDIPQVDFRLVGAGAGSSIIDGNAAGACISFRAPVSNAMVVAGFTLTNGIGELAFQGTTPVPSGGGIFIRNPQFSVGVPISPTIRNCELTLNNSFQGGAVYMEFGGDARFRNCHFRDNVGGDNDAIFARFGGSVTLEDCVVENHLSSVHATIRLDTCRGSFVRCQFENNVTNTASVLYSSNAPGPSFGPYIELRHCRFMGNGTSTGFGSAMIYAEATTATVIDNCLFAGNFGFGVTLIFPTTLATPSGLSIRNCTIANNSFSSNALAVIQGAPTFENSLVYGNSIVGSGVPLNPVVQFGGGFNIFGSVNSIIETPGNAPTLVGPTFIDPLNGDYHLQPGSVGVDGGTWAGLSPAPGLADDAVDLDGNPRVRGSAVDMGCYEAQHIAYHPAVAGRVGETSGGPYDILEVNGSSGDMFRTVSVPLGTASTVGMTQPMSAAGPSNFAIFGMVGEAQFELVTTVPLGIGAMVFPPCPLLPFIPDLFTLTNNFGGSCAQVIGSTLTPWVSAPFPPVGFPVTLTFQGIIEESPGVYVPTNAVIYKAE